MQPEYVNNRGLFSDHYLATRLPEQRDWESDYGRLRSRLSALLDEKADALPALSEAQTEQQFIRPVLDALGWSYETQITFRAPGRDYRPDYALFLSDEQQREARNTVSSREGPCGRPYLDKAAALAEAKYWERPWKSAAPTMPVTGVLTAAAPRTARSTTTCATPACAGASSPTAGPGAST
jgi:hypothetical protein